MRQTPEQKVELLLGELSAARSALLEAARAIPPAHRDTAFLGVWSVTDLLAHLIGWDNTNLQAVQQMLMGCYPTFFQQYDRDWQTYNAQLVQTHKIEPFEALLAEVERSHGQLLSFLGSLPARTLLDLKATNARGRTITARTLLLAEAQDERTHAGQVRAFQKTLRA